MGSRIVFRKAPIIIPYMDMRGWPSVRARLDSTTETMLKGVPSRMIEV